MTNEESVRCHYHYPNHGPCEKYAKLAGYWIEAENNGEMVGYVCSRGAEIMKAAHTLHKFRDVIRAKYPDAIMILVEPKCDGIWRNVHEISDTD